MDNQRRVEELEAKLQQACLGLHLAITVLKDMARVLGVEDLRTASYLQDLYKKVQP